MNQPKLTHLFAFLVFLCTGLSAYLTHAGLPTYWQLASSAVLAIAVVVFTFAANNIASLFTDPAGSNPWWAHLLAFFNGLIGVVVSVLPAALPGLDPAALVGIQAAVTFISGVLVYLANWLDPAGAGGVSARLAARTLARAKNAAPAGA